MLLDNILKVFQIIFYIVGGSVAVLTYLKAKNGLLNTINTEYHKKVIERLSLLSDELFAEFDRSGDKFWSKDNIAGEIIKRIHEELDGYKDDILSKNINPSDICGIPVPTKHQEIDAYLNRIKSDPFIPPSIRNKVISYLSGRSRSLMNSIIEEAELYIKGLGEGKYWEAAGTNEYWFHNHLMDRIRADGFGIQDNENLVIEIREDIRKYFEAYNPIKIKPQSL
ncbi:hypothetical protein AB9E15_30690 [Rhizobium leguminosarum]|uniref:hypothetical protein n=1 Tax=Rhizobium leguminosarum TaxID=384 RepID=UPI0004A3D5C5|nr:hypothetical protein [Rhizobium leguminosarum]